MTKKNDLRKVLYRLGVSHQSIGERFGVSRQAVGKWMARGKIPYVRAVQIEEMTGGKISVDSLRGVIS